MWFQWFHITLYNLHNLGASGFLRFGYKGGQQNYNLLFHTKKHHESSQCFSKIQLEPATRFELATYALRMRRSTSWAIPALTCIIVSNEGRFVNYFFTSGHSWIRIRGIILLISIETIQQATACIKVMKVIKGYVTSMGPNNLLYPF